MASAYACRKSAVATVKADRVLAKVNETASSRVHLWRLLCEVCLYQAYLGFGCKSALALKRCAPLEQPCSQQGLSKETRELRMSKQAQRLGQQYLVSKSGQKF